MFYYLNLLYWLNITFTYLYLFRTYEIAPKKEYNINYCYINEFNPEPIVTKVERTLRKTDKTYPEQIATKVEQTIVKKDKTFNQEQIDNKVEQTIVKKEQIENKEVEKVFEVKPKFLSLSKSFIMHYLEPPKDIINLEKKIVKKIEIEIGTNENAKDLIARLNTVKDAFINHFPNLFSVFRSMPFATLSQNFLNEKMIIEDQNIVQPKIGIVPKKIFDVKNEIRKIKIYDEMNSSLDFNQWSGLDVLEYVNKNDNINVKYYNKMIAKLEKLKGILLYEYW